MGANPQTPQDFSLCGQKQMAPVLRVGWLRVNIGPAERLTAACFPVASQAETACAEHHLLELQKPIGRRGRLVPCSLSWLQIEVHAPRRENDELRSQLTALGLSHLCGARAVAANAAVSRTILELGLSRCQSSGWMRWMSTTPMPAATAAPCSRERIQRPCAIR